MSKSPENSTHTRNKNQNYRRVKIEYMSVHEEYIYNIKKGNPNSTRSLELAKNAVQGELHR